MRDRVCLAGVSSVCGRGRVRLCGGPVRARAAAGAGEAAAAADWR